MEPRPSDAAFLLLKKQLAGDIRIVAQLNHRTFARTLRTPGPSPRDSDDVLLALETAHALEVRGDIAEAARWLRRAADEAEKQGNDARVLALAHAAADLKSASMQKPVVNVTPPPGRPREISDSDLTLCRPAAPPPRLARQREPHDSDPTLHRRATPPPLPTRSSSVPARSAPISFVQERSTAAQRPVLEHHVHIGAIRVAIKRPTPGGRSFTVERLDAHQPLPPGSVEALLVLASDDEDETAKRGAPPRDTSFARGK